MRMKPYRENRSKPARPKKTTTLRPFNLRVLVIWREARARYRHGAAKNVWKHIGAKIRPREVLPSRSCSQFKRCFMQSEQQLTIWARQLAILSLLLILAPAGWAGS